MNEKLSVDAKILKSLVDNFEEYKYITDYDITYQISLIHDEAYTNWLAVFIGDRDQLNEITWVAGETMIEALRNLADTLAIRDVQKEIVIN